MSLQLSSPLFPRFGWVPAGGCRCGALRGDIYHVSEGTARLADGDGLGSGSGVGWAAGRSKSTPHMPVVVCVCSNVRQFQSAIWAHIGLVFTAWPYFVSHNLWLAFHQSTQLHPNLQALAH